MYYAGGYMQEPLKYDVEVQKDGRIELRVPLPQGAQVTVFVVFFTKLRLKHAVSNCS